MKDIKGEAEKRELKHHLRVCGLDNRHKENSFKMFLKTQDILLYKAHG
jgi:hypothetical protein